MAVEVDASIETLRVVETNTKFSNAHVIKSLGGDARSAIGQESYRKQVATESNQRQAVEALSEIQYQYIQGQRRNYVVNGAFTTASFIIERAVTFGMAGSAATAGGSFLLATTGIVAKAALDEIGEFVKRKSQEEINRNLATHLEQFRLQQGQQAYEQLKQNPDPIAIKSIIEEKLQIVMVPLDGLDSVAQDEVNQFYSRHIATVLKNGFEALTNVQTLQANEIAANKKNIQALSQTFSTYARETNKLLESIVVDQKDIHKGLEELNGRVDKTEEDIEYMQGFLYGKMTPEEKLTAIRSGFFDGMPEEKRKSLEAQQELEVKRQRFNDNVETYLNGAQHIATICQNLGVSPEIVGTLNTAVGVGTSAFKAFTAFSSGNFLAGVSAVTEIFGFGGGRDIAAERHEEIMNAMKGLYEQNAAMQQQLLQLQQGQEQIIEYQRKTYELIIQVSEQIARGHEELLLKLQEIQHDVLYNRQLLIQAKREAYARCREICRTDDRVVVLDTSRSIYPKHSVLIEIHQYRRISFVEGLKLLTSPRTQPGEFDPFFWLETYKTPNDNTDDYVTDVFVPSMKLYCDGITDPSMISIKLSSLFAPMSTTKTLDRKMSVQRDAWQERFEESFYTLMSNSLLAPGAILEHGRRLSDCHYYFLVLSDDFNRVLEPIDLANGSLSKAGKIALIEALCMTDICIAQQTLLSGDALLVDIYKTKLSLKEQGENAPEPLKEKGIKIEKLFKYNPILGRNFIVYALQADVLAKSSFPAYQVALGASNKFMLEQCTLLDWEFIEPSHAPAPGEPAKPAGWTIKLGGRFLAVPTAEALIEGKLRFQTELLQLLDLRKRLLEELASYELVNNVTEEQRLRFNSMLLNCM